MKKKWIKGSVVPALILFIVLFAGATFAVAEVTPPTDFAAATAPASLKSVGKSTVTLTWNYSGEEQPKNFKIQGADFGAGVKTYTVPGGYRAYTLLNLKSGGTYHYRVRAITASGKSAWSKIIDVVVP